MQKQLAKHIDFTQQLPDTKKPANMFMLTGLLVQLTQYVSISDLYGFVQATSSGNAFALNQLVPTL